MNILQKNWRGLTTTRSFENVTPDYALKSLQFKGAEPLIDNKLTKVSDIQNSESIAAEDLRIPFVDCTFLLTRVYSHLSNVEKRQRKLKFRRKISFF